MGEDTLVYYANLDWEQEWAGETIVYEPNGVDIQTRIPYRPGQGSMDGRRHTSRPASSGVMRPVSSVYVRCIL